MWRGVLVVEEHEQLRVVSVAMRVGGDLVREVLFFPFAGRWDVVLDEIERAEVGVDERLALGERFVDADDGLALVPGLVFTHGEKLNIKDECCLSKVFRNLETPNTGGTCHF